MTPSLPKAVMARKRYDFIGIFGFESKVFGNIHSIVMHSFPETFYLNRDLAGFCLNNYELKPLKIQPLLFDLC